MILNVSRIVPNDFDLFKIFFCVLQKNFHSDFSVFGSTIPLFLQNSQLPAVFYKKNVGK